MATDIFPHTRIEEKNLCHALRVLVGVPYFAEEKKLELSCHVALFLKIHFGSRNNSEFGTKCYLIYSKAFSVIVYVCNLTYCI